MDRSMIKMVLVLCCIHFSFHSFGQKSNLLFRYFKEKRTVTYGLNNRRTRMLSEPSSIYSGYVGIKFGNQLKHVVTLNSTVLWVGDYKETPYSDPLEVQLNYIGFAEEFRFWKHDQWSLNLYLHLGVGKGRFRSMTPVESRWLYPLEAGVHGAYSLNKCLELRGGVGYRYVFNSGELPLHGPYYKLGVGLDIKEFKSWSKEFCAFLSDFKRKVTKTNRKHSPCVEYLF